MRMTMIALILGIAASTTVRPAAQVTPGRELRLSFNADGTVNLAARNVTAREILAEWARQCQCHMVNAERLPGGAIMMPLQFEGAAQRNVLESLLRSAAGYVLTPRATGASGASDYGTIYILATSTAVAGPYVPPPTTMPALPTAGSPDDELSPVATIPVAEPAQAGTPPPAGARPASPFTRSSSPFMPTPATPTTAPGTVAPVPQTTIPMGPGTSQPSASPPPRPGMVVPIVPITPSNP